MRLFSESYGTGNQNWNGSKISSATSTFLSQIFMKTLLVFKLFLIIAKRCVTEDRLQKSWLLVCGLSLEVFVFCICSLHYPHMSPENNFVFELLKLILKVVMNLTLVERRFSISKW